MDDDKSISETPQNNIGKDGPKADPGQEKPKERKQKFSGVIFGALELLALVFWLLAVDVFHSEDTLFLHALFLSLAGSFFLLGAAHLLNKAFTKKKHRRWVWRSCTVLCIIFALLVVRSRPIKSELLLPWMEITTLPGFTARARPGFEITGEMFQKYREQRFLIRNPNSVDLRNFNAKVLLPEPAIAQVPQSIGPMIVNAPPGIHVRWIPDSTIGMVAFGNGGGGVRWTGGEARPKAEWLLSIDMLPAFKSIEIPFLTALSDLSLPDHLGLTDTDTNARVLVNYVLGDFQFLTTAGWTTQQVVMPILFDRTNRTFRTLAPENTTTNWKMVERREMWP